MRIYLAGSSSALERVLAAALVLQGLGHVVQTVEEAARP